jgi:hypothetical protein
MTTPTSQFARSLPFDAPDRVRHLLDGFQIAVAALALVPCLRGQGQPLIWLSLVALLAAVRLLLGEAYRRRVRAWLAELWASAERYPDRDDGRAWLAALIFVVLPAGFLFLSNNQTQGSGDTWSVLPTACSLATEANWEISEYLDLAPRNFLWDGNPENRGLPYAALRRPDGVYSRYSAGMVVFAFPVALTARLLGADLSEARVQERLEKWTAAWVAAGALGLFFLLARHLAPAGPAAFATACLTVGSAVFSTLAQGLWQQGGVVFWSLFVLLLEFHGAKRPWEGWCWLQGLGCALMLACRPSAVLFIVPFGLWVLRRHPARGLLLALAGGLAFAPWAWLYGSTYGGLFGPSVQEMNKLLWFTGSAGGLGGFFFSPGRGVFVYQPWAVLAIASLLPAVRRGAPGEGGPAGWPLLCLAVIGLHVAMVAAWRFWWGGHCWGSRYAAEFLPLALLLCLRPIAALWANRAGKGLLLGLALLSFLLHAPAVYGHAADWDNVVDVDRHPEALWSWSWPPFLYPWQRR